MSRYLLRGSEDEFAAWRSAAGRVPLSVWIRDALNAAAEGPSRAAVVEALGRPEVREALSPVVVRAAADPARSFKPDFRPDRKGGKP